MSNNNVEVRSVLHEVIPSMFLDDYEDHHAQKKVLLQKVMKNYVESGKVHIVMDEMYLALQTHLKKTSNGFFRQFESSALDDLHRNCFLLNGLHKLMSYFVKAINYLFEFLDYKGKNKEFEEQLLSIFNRDVIQLHWKTIVEAIKLVRITPFAVDPSVLHNLVIALHKMIPNLHESEQELLSFYIPNVRKACTIEDMQEEIRAAKLLTLQLQSSPEYTSSSMGVRTSTKRSIQEQYKEDAECSSSLLASLLQQ